MLACSYGDLTVSGVLLLLLPSFYLLCRLPATIFFESVREGFF